MQYIVIFYTFSGVIQLENEFKKSGIVYETIPAPRKLSVDCGVSLLFECENILQMISEVKTQNIHRIYEINAVEYNLIYENN
jgi:hypothetical protein